MRVQSPTHIDVISLTTLSRKSMRDKEIFKFNSYRIKGKSEQDICFRIDTTLKRKGKKKDGLDEVSLDVASKQQRFL